MNGVKALAIKRTEYSCDVCGVGSKRSASVQRE